MYKLLCVYYTKIYKMLIKALRIIYLYTSIWWLEKVFG